MGTRSDREYFPLLDGIRGLAAIAVMFRHMPMLGVHSVAQSYLGVDVFFALSGAVIASAYERKLLAGMRTREFMRRRVLRLWPMIALGVILGLVNALWGQPEADLHGRECLYAVLSLILAGDNPLFQMIMLNRPSWTMTLEFAVNLATPRWSGDCRGSCLSPSASFCAVILGFGALTQHGLDIGDSYPTLAFGAARTGYAFFIGVGLYRLHRKGRLPIPQSLRGGLGVALCALVLGACLFAPAPHGLRWLVAFLSVLVLVPALVSLGLSSRVGGRWIKPSLALGALSYPLYLIHDPLAQLTGSALTRSGHANLLHLGAVVFALTVPAMALGVHYWFDEPVRAWLGELRSPRAHQPLEAVAE